MGISLHMWRHIGVVTGLIAQRAYEVYPLKVVEGLSWFDNSNGSGRVYARVRDLVVVMRSTSKFQPMRKSAFLC